ncbi:MAG: helix-turn-helix domain-containing protein [Alphaproteobacteria bacterium]|nr:helix-turn-helix domain-containing protein [Alphaproteobacteria bacterium]
MSPNYNTEKVRKFNKSLDTFIGEKVKQRRAVIGMSQDKLGSYLGITFQQVQKYEKGVNRISASMLYTIATVLNTDIQYFIDGFNDGDSNSFNEFNSPVYEVNIQNQKESLDLLKAYYAIPDPIVRKKVMELVKAFSHSLKKKQNEK